MVLLVAACALIDKDGRILMSQRPEGKDLAGLWEFPGGKIEKNERPEQTIKRELWEELGIEPCESCLQAFNFVAHQYDDFNLVMLLYLCRQWDGFAIPKEGQNLKWVFPDKIPKLNLVPADIPLAIELADRIKPGQRFAR